MLQTLRRVCVQTDPYIVASIKANRRQRTRTLSNTTHPVWEETLTVIINDPDAQSLSFQLMDDDPGAFDDVRLGISEIPRGTSVWRCMKPEEARSALHGLPCAFMCSSPVFLIHTISNPSPQSFSVQLMAEDPGAFNAVRILDSAGV